MAAQTIFYLKGLLEARVMMLYLHVYVIYVNGNLLLPTESDKRGVLGVGSIPVATLPSRQYMEMNASQLHINRNIIG